MPLQPIFTSALFLKKFYLAHFGPFQSEFFEKFCLENFFIPQAEFFTTHATAHPPHMFLPSVLRKKTPVSPSLGIGSRDGLSRPRDPLQLDATCPLPFPSIEPRVCAHHHAEGMLPFKGIADSSH
jgi:hypothetical protein